MIKITTPTIRVHVNSGQVEAAHCNVYGTFSQGDYTLTLEPLEVTSDVQHNTTTMRFDMTQLQTAGFKPGVVHFQVNLVDWMNYRAATNIVQIYVGTNLLKEVLTHV